VELRAGDRQLLEELLFLDNRETHAAIAAERAFLAEIGGGCRLPVGVYGTIQDNTLHLMARIIDEVTMRIDEGKASGTITDAAKTGRMLAWEILNKSAER
jgi:hydroxymethylbilane synthase